MATTPFTKENAKELGRQGGLASAETRRKQRRLSEDVRARRVFERASPDMADEIVKAAKGEAPYEELPVDERVKLMLKVIEFGIGRPGAGPKREAASPQEAQADGAGFSIGGDDV